MSKRPLIPGCTARHGRYGSGVVIEAAERFVLVRFRDTTTPRRIRAVMLTFVGLPNVETLATLDMTRRAQAARAAYVADAKSRRAIREAKAVKPSNVVSLASFRAQRAA